MSSGGLDRLSGEDAEILGLETDAIMGHKASVLVLDAAEDGASLDIEKLRGRIESRLDSEPRARQCVMETPRGAGRPIWVDSADFNLAEHVVRVVGDGGDEATLRELTAELMAERLDHSKPMWTIHKLDLSRGQTGLILRIHHCIADGIGTLRFLDGLVWDEEREVEQAEESGPELRATQEWTPRPAPSSRELVISGIADRTLGVARGAVGAIRTVGDPGALRESLGGLARIPGALIRELRPRATAGTRFDRAIGSRREVAWLQRPIAELKAIGAAHSNGGHVTINDVLLAGIAGGIRSWLGEEAAGQQMRVKVPVSMHSRDVDPDAIGNRDSFLFVDLPLHEPDPAERLRLINAETAERKEHHDAAALYGFFQGISHLSPLHHEVSKASMSPREFTLAASNVPGPREQRWVLGCPVVELYSVTEPAVRHALRVSAISLEGDLAIALCTDPEAFDGLDALARAIDDAIDELAATS